MSEDGWAALTERDTVLLLAALAVYFGGVVGFARNLPRVLRRSAAWRRDTELHTVSSVFTLTVLIVFWPVSVVYLAWRIAVRRRSWTECIRARLIPA
ncbi:hypothetical protein [Streptomyces jeddahensis]|uniref:Uncharacterized protein n=1 Tax=Streptomyces jeddahensis TaxID=1716141 RepID=A0A177HFT9_9ACTN|nr:hypothetical protein [Streptomyces jeddahensis]OAH09883.1 hypothetical protein STSP_68820 [Streptomyces jeddahensis]